MSGASSLMTFDPEQLEPDSQLDLFGHRIPEVARGNRRIVQIQKDIEVVMVGIFGHSGWRSVDGGTLFYCSETWRPST
jgi:hypothetical protein